MLEPTPPSFPGTPFTTDPADVAIPYLAPRVLQSSVLPKPAKVEPGTFQIAPPGTRVAYADPQQPDGPEVRRTMHPVLGWASVFDTSRGQRMVPLVFDADVGAAIDATCSPLFLGVQFPDEEDHIAAMRFTKRYLTMRLEGVLHAALAALGGTPAAPPVVPPEPLHDPADEIVIEATRSRG